MARPGFSAAEMNPWYPLATCIIVFVRAYFDLSAYTDLAIGFSRLFGFRIMENFHYPFLQEEPRRVLARLAHLALELVPQQRLLPGLRSDAQALARPVREHAHHGPLALRQPELGVLGSVARHRAGGRVAVGALEEGEEEGQRRRPGSRPCGATSRWVRWLGYPTTFMYAAFGYAFVGTSTLRHALKLMVLALEAPLKWLGVLG